MRIVVLFLLGAAMLAGSFGAAAQDAAAPLPAAAPEAAAPPADETPVEDKPGAFRVAFGEPVIALFAIIAIGLFIGRIKVAGLNLGSSGVMFVALFFGAMGFTIPPIVGTVGLVLFVYCIGIAAGPGFFRAFYESGTEFAKLGLLLVGAGAATTMVFAHFAAIPADLAAGIFAGSLTSTPGLAAATDALPIGSDVTIGYGIAYPFGIVGVVLFVQVIPRLLGLDLNEESAKHESIAAKRSQVKRRLIEIENPMVAGKKIAEVGFLANAKAQISRVMRDDRLVPITKETTLQPGDHILIVGETTCLHHITEFLGKESEHPFYWDTESERMQVVATSKEIVGKALQDLNVLNQFGVTISRIVRNEVGFVPIGDTIVLPGDTLYVVGEPAAVKAFSEFAGHRARALDETDLISLAVGVTAGCILGMIPIGMPGTQGFSLGLAGGPLLVALLLGHFGRVGSIRGYMPRASRYLMTEIGLVFFLASAGIKAGDRLLSVIEEQGLILLVMGVFVTLIPMVAGYLFARYVLKLNILQILGGTCGGMTSTPGLGVITSKTDSDIPTVSYATAYPVALILMTLFAQIIIGFLS